MQEFYDNFKAFLMTKILNKSINLIVLRQI